MKILTSTLFVLLLASTSFLYYLNNTVGSKNLKLIQTLQFLERKTDEVKDLEFKTLTAVKLNGKKIEISNLKVLQSKDTVYMKALLRKKTLVYKFDFTN